MPRLLQFANNAVSKLSANISASDTTISILPGDGAKFPSLSGGKYFMATLIKVDGSQEIVKVTARSSDVLTVARAAEPVGSTQTALTFSAGDRFELRLTGGALSSELDRLTQLSAHGAQSKNANYAVVANDSGDLLRVSTTAAPVTITLPLLSSLTDDFEIIIAKVTDDANPVTIQCSGANIINGASAYSLKDQFSSAWLVADRAGGTWTAVMSGGSQTTSIMITDPFTGDGTANPLTLSGDPGGKQNTIFIIGGVPQLRSTYSVTGKTLTPSSPVPNGAAVEVWWWQASNFAALKASATSYTADDTTSAIRTVQAKLRETKSFDDFPGVDPTGATSSTTGVRQALAWLSAGNRRLTGSAGAKYLIDGTLNVTGRTISVDGAECIFINAINGDPADPLFLINGASSGFVTIENIQVQFDAPSSKGHTIAVIGNGQSPQEVVIRNVRPNYQLGNGKDYSGNPIPACAVYAYGVYSIRCEHVYAQNGSAGLRFDTVQKVLVDACTIDSSTNEGLYFANCSTVVVDARTNLTGCGQTGQGALYFDNCMSLTFQNGRIKGGAGSQIKAGPTPSKMVRILGNHCEVYSNTDDALALHTAIENLLVESNNFLFIGQGYTYTAAIALRDRTGGGYLGGAARIVGNGIVVGGNDTLVDAVYVGSSLNSFRAVLVESNNIGGGGVSSTVVNAINMAGNGFDNVVRLNSFGNSGGVVTNAVVVASGQTRLLVEGSSSRGTVTNMLVDNSSSTRIYDAGSFNLTMTGLASAVNVACTYERQGRSVTLRGITASGTSNSVNAQLTGLPAALQPASNQWVAIGVFDNGVDAAGWLRIGGASIDLYKGNVGGTFTSTGTKGLRTFCFTYLL